MNGEKYEYHFDSSFGLKLAVTKSEFIFYRVAKELYEFDEIPFYGYLSAQWEMIANGWTKID